MASERVRRQPGRPPHEPIKLRRPELVEMSDEERDVLVRALADMLTTWMNQHRLRPREQVGAGS